MDIISIFDPTSGSQSRLALQILRDEQETRTIRQLMGSVVVLLRLFESNSDRWSAELWDVVKNKGVQFVHKEHWTDMMAATMLRVHQKRAETRVKQKSVVVKAFEESIHKSSVSKGSWYVTRIHLVPPARDRMSPLLHFIIQELKDQMGMLCVTCQDSRNAILAAEIKSMGVMLRRIDPESHRMMFEVAEAMQEQYVGINHTAGLLQQVVRECAANRITWCLKWAKVNSVIWNLDPERDSGGSNENTNAKYVKLMDMFYPTKSCTVILNADSLGVNGPYHNNTIFPDADTLDQSYGIADFEKFLQCFHQSLTINIMECDDPRSSPVYERYRIYASRFSSIIDLLLLFVNICDPEAAVKIVMALSMMRSGDINTRVNGGLDLAAIIIDSRNVDRWERYAESQNKIPFGYIANTPERNLRWADTNRCAMQYCEENRDHLGRVVVSSDSIGDGSLLKRLGEMIVDLNSSDWMLMGS
ncbi:hypothetical protein T484DRAFT_1757303 [Baffinella frigidus]|nr:hypothetical protein T484DRAFT_1757303 [Cryptophyta sp. CCMP2293]